MAVEIFSLGDRLEVNGNFKVGAGIKAIVVITVSGKSLATVRFLLKQLF